ncbi:hypothetical protein UAK_00082 [Enterococcus raffinosus ATCC 49464]|nr:methyltransferase domain-containing protein [Enterococcus raffinosus]EOH81847.1 hypothetical protein UAK_00082 [Enterococcus raffinosus ATCC 49464]EOT78316.1 hypothetical protein I590_01854 [Enterococcus raffinosus ATCC 49464]GMS55113.1 hypothetical protein NUITMVRE36_21040 [Enterococcus raffinosus]
MVKWTFKYITVYPPKNVLDIGIRNGASTNLIRKHFPTNTIYGIDCSSTAVEEARKRNRDDVIIKQEKIEETDLPTNFLNWYLLPKRIFIGKNWINPFLK